MKNKKLNSHKGFTLIELLVVIAIISILAALLMANFIGIRQKGRDGQRKSNLYQVQSALELYRSDNGSYPTTINTCGKNVQISYNSTVYMQNTPCDPLDDNPYTYTSDGTTYTIVACLENAADANRDVDGSGNTAISASCTGSGVSGRSSRPASFTLTNP